MKARLTLDAADRAIVSATQEGLALTSRPFEDVAKKTGMPSEEVLARTRRMTDEGIIRRIAAVPNHYALGLRANGMTVWNVDDDQVDRLGREVGALEFVTHCYLRPRVMPDWPYNLFAMVHGADRHEVEDKTQQIAVLLGDAARQRDVLYSTRILKKTGFRLPA